MSNTKPTSPARISRTTAVMAALAIALVVVVLLSWPRNSNTSAQNPDTKNPPAKPATSTAPSTQPGKLVGTWDRGDGYRIVVSAVDADGKAQAAYFNPQRKINVSEASVKTEQGVQTLVVILKDIGYPGSRYTLKYDPTKDLLKGEYFQAVQQETYDVMFGREK